MITILQQPERLTPSNLEMVFTLSSDNTTQQNFKFVVDVYYKPYENGYYPDTFEGEKIARLKVRPNKEGNCIVDIQEIVSNKLTANIRKDYEEPIGQQYFSMFVGGNNGYDSYFVTKPTLFLGFSQINGNNHIVDFEDKDHFNEFRVIVGEEYDVDDVKTIFIDDRPNLPFSEFGTSRVDSGTHNADFDSVDYTDAGLYYTGIERGINWYHTNPTETSIIESSVIYQYDDRVTTTAQPTGGDKLILREIYSDREFVYEWSSQPGEGQGDVVGWVYLLQRYNDNIGFYSASRSPHSFYSWVSSVRREDRLQRKDKIGDVINIDFGNYQGRGNHLFNWSPYKIPTSTGAPGTDKADIGFLSPMPYKVSTTDTYPDIYDFYSKNFEKNWYYGQPIMLSFFNSYLHEFVNEVRGIVRTTRFNNGSFDNTLLHNTKLNGGGPLVNATGQYPPIQGQEVENRLTHFTDNQVNTEYYSNQNGGIKEIYYFLITDNDIIQSGWENNGNTPYIKYVAKDLGCFEKEPIYFTYLNPLGGWDTFTFGKKNTKSYTKKTKSYDKGKYIQGEYYNRLSNEEKTIVYDQETTISVTAQSDYVSEEESKYIEDLVLSPYVYITTHTQGIGGNGIESNPEVIPVVITDNSVEEYKKNYQKLKQYTINFEFNNIKGYPVQL